MIAYLIKTTLCALLLYAVYALLFEQEKMHRFKRFYLLASLIFSMLVPFITFDIRIPKLPVNLEVRYFKPSNNAVTHPVNLTATTETTAQLENTSTDSHINYTLLVFGIYVAVTSLFLFRLFRNCRQMLTCVWKNDCADYNRAVVVLLREKVVPYSFLRYIFVNREDYTGRLVPKELIAHEYAHVRQHHTYDIIFIELLIAFGWFNPVFYFYRNKIKQNHEFLADDAVVGKNNKIIPEYLNILISCIPQNKNMSFTSNFNFLITKKRFIMMTKTTSKKRIWCSSIALIPVLIAAIGVFSTKMVAQNDTNVLPVQTNETVQDSKQIITPGKGASQEQMAEFQKIVNRYKTDSTKWRTFSLSEKDEADLYAIYVQMDTTQRKEQNIRLVSPLTTKNARRSITQNEWKLWNMPNKRNEIWLDGEKVDYTALTSHTRSDFAFFISRFTNEKKEIFRIDLWTKKGFDDYQMQNGQQISIAKLLEVPPQIWFITTISFMPPKKLKSNKK